MSKLNREVIEKNKDSIKKGAYYFGIVGRLSIILGFISLIVSFGAYIPSVMGPNVDAQIKVAGGLVSSAENIIYGFLFLMARDAFRAIDALTNEIEEIV